MRTFTCKHKTWGENLLYLRPYLKAFPVFNVLETRKVCLWTIDRVIFQFTKKIYLAVFCKMRNLQAWTKLRAKTVTKAAECKLIKFFSLAIAQSNSPLCLYAVFNGIKLLIPLCVCMQFSMESNYYEMNPLFQSLSFSLKIS